MRGLLHTSEHDEADERFRMCSYGCSVPLLMTVGVACQHAMNPSSYNASPNIALIESDVEPYMASSPLRRGSRPGSESALDLGNKVSHQEAERWRLQHFRPRTADATAVPEVAGARVDEEPRLGR